MAVIDGTDFAYDTPSSTEEVDTIFGLSRLDKLYGLSGDDGLFGGSGGDSSLLGGSGADGLYGDQGNDSPVFGGGGIDTILGGNGNDTLAVISQRELVSGELFDGGAGSDTLILAPSVSLPAGVTLTSIETILYGQSPPRPPSRPPLRLKPIPHRVPYHGQHQQRAAQ